MMVNELLAEHRADMLLLLVGTNPLPVLVSADVTLPP